MKKRTVELSALSLDELDALKNVIDEERRKRGYAYKVCISVKIDPDRTDDLSDPEALVDHLVDYIHRTFTLMSSDTVDGSVLE